jgi:hypothetical protein
MMNQHADRVVTIGVYIIVLQAVRSLYTAFATSVGQVL